MEHPEFLVVPEVQGAVVHVVELEAAREYLYPAQAIQRMGQLLAVVKQVVAKRPDHQVDSECYRQFPKAQLMCLLKWVEWEAALQAE